MSKFSSQTVSRLASQVCSFFVSGAHSDNELPGDVLKIAAAKIGLNQSIASLKPEPLTTTNPVWRVGLDGKNWIIKKSLNPRKDVLVSQILRHYDMGGVDVVPLGQGWIVMEDAGIYTLENLPSQYYSREIFADLGRLAVSAMFLGMRDRKLANIVVNTLPERISLRHVDYEGAFQAGLFNRMFRPEKYFRYLLTRMLFGVAARFQEHDLEGAYKIFVEAFQLESARVKGIPSISGSNMKMTIRQRLMIRTCQMDSDRLNKLLQLAFVRLFSESSLSRRG